jgi:uncharacterized membrane protein YdbT with pleckstrin-like domain
MDGKQEQTLYEEHPAMFRSHPFYFILCVILILAFGLGLIILLIWWLEVLAVTLTVTNERITLRRGIFSKHTNEVYHTDVRNVQLSQTVAERMLDVGKISISSAGHAGIEIEVSGIRSPDKVKSIIDQHRRMQL